MNVKPLALITGFGGINSAGRSSSHISYKNLIFDTLNSKDQLEVLQDLAVMQGIIEPIGRSWETTSGDSIDLKSYLIENQKSIRSGTMVRKIDHEIYDTDGIITNDIQASAAGQLPSGFDPSSLYAARQHPKALQMTVFGMGDALGQLGIDWDVIQSKIGPDHPLSGEKMSRFISIYKVKDFKSGLDKAIEIQSYQGAGHSIGIHTNQDRRSHEIALLAKTCRVIVNQAHCFATGGFFDNGSPFSLSMGCGSWGGNSIDDNLNWQHFVNRVKIVRIIPENRPDLSEIFSDYWKTYGK